MKIISGLLGGLACLVGASHAAAQSAQLIVTGPPALAGSYAAVTYGQAPSNVTSTTPIPQGNFFIYDDVNCVVHSLTKPAGGSGAGKVALLTGSYPATCTSYDDIVRELQADGVVAVVFGFSNGAWSSRMSHGSPDGLTVPVLDMQVDEVSQSIRSAVLAGATVSASFVAVPGMAMAAGEESPNYPSTGAFWDLSTFDLDPTTAGIQQDFAFPITLTNPCKGVSFHWDPAMHLITTTVPASDTYTGSCNKTYLIRDTEGFQGIGLLRLNVGAATGWWWNARESGRGFFIEQEGTTIVMAGYIYDDAGNPIWFLASGAIVDNMFTAEMQTYRNGQTLTGPYVGPATGPSLGTITVRFTSAEQATVTWPGGTFSIVRFTYATGGPGLPQNGWWWSSSESGRGFSIEVKGNTLVMAGYMYSAAGTPIWYLTSGTMTSSSTYTGSLQQYAMGQSMGGRYRRPQLINANVGTVSLVFTDAKNGTITLPDGRQVAITRFAF